MPRTMPPPMPPAVDDQERIREAGARRSVMEGTWESLLRRHLIEQLGRKRSAMVGLPDTSSNLMKQIVFQIARLYAKTPKVGNPEEAGLEVMNEQLRAAKVWGLAQRNQRLTLAINECVMVLGFLDGPKGEKANGRLSCEVVPADFCWGLQHPQDPGQFGVFYRARKRMVRQEQGPTREVWTWDCWDVQDGGEDGVVRPSFRVLSEDLRNDLSALFVDPSEWQGASYPYRLRDGTPVVPAVLYHSEPHSGLWNPWSNSEILFGTLQDALNWTSTNHSFMRASWAQRYIGGGSIRGTVTKTADGEKVAVATEDPASVTQIRSDGDGSLTVGQWGAAVDIAQAERFARNYGLRLSVHFGLNPADVSFESRSAMSGVALTVSRDGLREVQGLYAPLFRESDLLLLERASAVLRANGIEVPETGYTIEYASVELGPSERRIILENLREELEMGLTTKVAGVMRLNPGLSEDEAEEILEDVREEIESERAKEPAPLPAQEPPGTPGEPVAGLQGEQKPGALQAPPGAPEKAIPQKRA